MVLKIEYNIIKLQKSHTTSFYDITKITSPIIRHQTDVTKFSIFEPHT